MKLKRILAISLSLTMLFSMSLSSVAEGERTTPVEVPVPISNESIIDIKSDVDVRDKDFAVLVTTEGLSEGSGASATIDGNVSLVNNGSARTIESYSDTGNTAITVTGDVYAYSANGESTGIYTRALEGHNSSVTVGGDVTVDSYNSDATDVFIEAEDSSVDVKIGGSVMATSLHDKYGEAIGIIIANTDSTVNVDVGSVINGSTGLEILNGSGATSNVTIHGDLTVDRYGIVSAGTAGKSQSNVVIEGTLDAFKGAVLLTDKLSKDPTTPEKSDLNLYVWKINTDKNAAIAQKMTYNPSTMDEPEIENDEDFVKNNIYYIIKVKQPNEGGSLRVTDEDGNSLTEKNGNIVAKEGTVLLLKTDLDADYVIDDAYGDISQNLSLVKDANGNYSLVVKRGGGVYFNAAFRRLTPMSELRRREEAQDAIGFIEAGPKNGDNITIACFNSDKLDPSVVDAIKKQTSEMMFMGRKNLIRLTFTITILCMLDDVYGKIVIDNKTFENYINKDDGTVSLADLKRDGFFYPITSNTIKRSSK
jgi:hypothetical protein